MRAKNDTQGSLQIAKREAARLNQLADERINPYIEHVNRELAEVGVEAWLLGENDDVVESPCKDGVVKTYLGFARCQGAYQLVVRDRFYAPVQPGDLSTILAHSGRDIGDPVPLAKATRQVRIHATPRIPDLLARITLVITRQRDAAEAVVATELL